MVTLNKGKDSAAPCWWTEDHGDGIHSITMRCPEGHERRIGERHAVREDGTVHPSIVCTGDGCTFHEFGRLEGYDLPMKPRGEPFATTARPPQAG